MSAQQPGNGSSGSAAADPWETAYLRFETPAQEVRKFQRRLRAAGAEAWPRDARVVELFCGRASGIEALAAMGFRRLIGVDRSTALVAASRGRAPLCAGDCRALPLGDGSVDVALVQGGLHHLEVLPEDLDRVLAEIRRVLGPEGRVVIVEPWLTPFLRLVHAACGRRWLRRVWPRLDALAEMIEHERATYERWLAQPDLILDRLEHHLAWQERSIGWGKLRGVAGARPAA